MAQSLSNVLLPVVWSTKDREPWIADSISEWFHSYVVGELPSTSATFGTDYDWVPPFQQLCFFCCEGRL